MDKWIEPLFDGCARLGLRGLRTKNPRLPLLPPLPNSPASQARLTVANVHVKPSNTAAAGVLHSARREPASQGYGLQVAALAESLNP